jgi:predicted phage tail protein
MQTIRVYGHLAKLLGQRTFKAAVSSAAEAVRFLLVNFPWLERHMSAQYYRVTVGGFGLTLDDLHHPVGQQEIRIIPVIGGAGGDVGQILLGVALVIGSFFIPGAAAIGTLGLSAPIAVKGLVASIGLFMTLGGVAGLLTPTPQLSLGSDGANDPRKSYSFSGIQNTSRQGVPVPIVYGETLVGSVVISAGIDTVQVKA